MKTLIVLFTGLLISLSAMGEIWEKPEYTPDENHLSKEAIEEQEEIPDEEKDQQHQETKPMGNNNEFQKIDDELTEDQESAQ